MSADASNRRFWLNLVLAGSALSALVAMTDPFTVAADVLTALPLVVIVAVFSVRKMRSEKARRAGEWCPPSETAGVFGMPGYGSSAGDVERTDHGNGPETGHQHNWAWLWVFVLSMVVVFELVNLFQIPRADHPTLSSMLDSLESIRWIKGVMFFAWLVLGLYLTGR